MDILFWLAVAIVFIGVVGLATGAYLRRRNEQLGYPPEETAVDVNASSTDPAMELRKLVIQLALVVDQIEKIYWKAAPRSGHPNMGQIAAVGETKHLDELEKQGGELWRRALPYASTLCGGQATGMFYDLLLRQAFATGGLCNEQQQGSYWVSESIITGVEKTPANYHPLSQLKGELAALRAVPNH